MTTELLYERTGGSLKIDNRASVPEGALCVLRGPLAYFTKPTLNGRLYSRKLWERVMALHAQRLSERKILGEVEHPEDPQSDYRRTAHLITEWSLDEKTGAVKGSLWILDTPNGRILYALARAGIPIGISSRGKGALVPVANENFNEVDPETYDFQTFDAVSNPSNGSFVSLSESLRQPAAEIERIFANANAEAAEYYNRSSELWPGLVLLENLQNGVEPVMQTKPRASKKDPAAAKPATESPAQTALTEAAPANPSEPVADNDTASTAAALAILASQPAPTTAAPVVESTSPPTPTPSAATPAPAPRAPAVSSYTTEDLQEALVRAEAAKHEAQVLREEVERLREESARHRNELRRIEYRSVLVENLRGEDNSEYVYKLLGEPSDYPTAQALQESIQRIRADVATLREAIQAPLVAQVNNLTAQLNEARTATATAQAELVEARDVVVSVSNALEEMNSRAILYERLIGHPHAGQIRPIGEALFANNAKPSAEQIVGLIEQFRPQQLSIAAIEDRAQNVRRITNQGGMFDPLIEETAPPYAAPKQTSFGLTFQDIQRDIQGGLPPRR